MNLIILFKTNSYWCFLSPGFFNGFASEEIKFLSCLNSNWGYIDGIFDYFRFCLNVCVSTAADDDEDHILLIYQIALLVWLTYLNADNYTIFITNWGRLLSNIVFKAQSIAMRLSFAWLEANLHNMDWP